MGRPALKNMILKSVCLTLLLFGCPSAVLAQGAGNSPTKMLEELYSNLSQARETETQLKANRVLKQTYDREKAIVERERAGYERDLEQYNKDLARFNQDVNRYDEQCDKKLDRDAYNACEAIADRLEPQKNALDQRLSVLDGRRAKIMEQINLLNQQDGKRATAAEVLLERYDEFDRRARDLVTRLALLPAIRNSNRNCSSSPSLEAAHLCMAKILSP
jgi:chromosome segregation ATPase